VVCANAELAELLRTFSGKNCSGSSANKCVQQWVFYIFGHGLYEKSAAAYVGMTGRAWYCMCQLIFLAGHCQCSSAILMNESRNIWIIPRIASTPRTASGALLGCRGGRQRITMQRITTTPRIFGPAGVIRNSVIFHVQFFSMGLYSNCCLMWIKEQASQ